MIYYSGNQKIDIASCDNLTVDGIIPKLEAGYFLNVIDRGNRTTVIHANAEVKAFSVKAYERKSGTSEPELTRAHTGNIADLRSEIFNLGSGLGEHWFLVKVNELEV